MPSRSAGRTMHPARLAGNVAIPASLAHRAGSTYLVRYVANTARSVRRELHRRRSLVCRLAEPRAPWPGIRSPRAAPWRWPHVRRRQRPPACGPARPEIRRAGVSVPSAARSETWSTVLPSRSGAMVRINCGAGIGEPRIKTRTDRFIGNFEATFSAERLRQATTGRSRKRKETADKIS